MEIDFLIAFIIILLTGAMAALGWQRLENVYSVTKEYNNQLDMMIPPRKPLTMKKPPPPPPAKKPKFKQCPGCGASKTVLKNGNYECDYCGSDAVPKKDKTVKPNFENHSKAYDKMFAIITTQIASYDEARKMVGYDIPETDKNDRVRF